MPWRKWNVIWNKICRKRLIEKKLGENTQTNNKRKDFYKWLTEQWIQCFGKGLSLSQRLQWRQYEKRMAYLKAIPFLLQRLVKNRTFVLQLSLQSFHFFRESVTLFSAFFQLHHNVFQVCDSSGGNGGVWCRVVSALMADGFTQRTGRAANTGEKVSAQMARPWGHARALVIGSVFRAMAVTLTMALSHRVFAWIVSAFDVIIACIWSTGFVNIGL